jgi:carboxylesterase type B
MKPWEGVWVAGDFGSFCMANQHVLGPIPYEPISGQEDCLYLNIYTPSIPEEELNEEDLFDVIFYIPGGAFMFGSSNFYGAKYFMDRKVIFVTINYRVGPLGMFNFVLTQCIYFHTKQIFVFYYQQNCVQIIIPLKCDDTMQKIIVCY